MREVVTLPAERRILGEIADLINRFADVGPLSGAELNDVHVAVAEACTNAITHGLHEDRTRSFELTVENSSKSLIVTLREDGTPFDPSLVTPCDLTSNLEDREIGGLGIYLIRRLMDSVEYSTESDGMKVLKMIKRSGKVS